MNKLTKRNLFWHFAPADGRLAYGDGRTIEVGKTLTVEPPIILAARGLHASYRAIDALSHARSPLVCRVRLGGEFRTDGTLAVASERTVLSKADASKVLHEFACWCAERALRAANVTDERCWRAVEVKRSWLAGKAGDQELKAIRASAWAAARAATSEAEWAARAAGEAARAAGEAAWAAGEAAWAARAAAWAAARAASAAASEAASAAERVAQNRRLESVLKKLLAKKYN